jgi:hypothetical protein
MTAAGEEEHRGEVTELAVAGDAPGCAALADEHAIGGFRTAWTEGAEVKGAPALYEFTQGDALTFKY